MGTMYSGIMNDILYYISNFRNFIIDTQFTYILYTYVLLVLSHKDTVFTISVYILHPNRTSYLNIRILFININKNNKYSLSL